MKTKEFKEGILINRRVTKKLKSNWKILTLKEIKKVVAEIPDYNPVDYKDAISIGNNIILDKYSQLIWKRRQEGVR